jgi:cell division protein FtsB
VAVASSRPRGRQGLRKPSSARRLAGWLGRVGAAGIGVSVIALAGIQFGRIVSENVTMSRHLSSVQTQIATMQKREGEQRAEIHRLQNPEGAIPEIHDRLRLVRADEAIIFVSPGPSLAP